MDHPNTQAIFRYWNELRGDRDAPTRSEVDPRRIAEALEVMFIFEALPDGRLRFRLAGTALCEMMGMEARGMPAEALMTDAHGAELTGLARRVLGAPGVGLMRVRGVDAAGTEWSGEALLLPLRSELGELDRVLGCVALYGASRRDRPAAPLALRCLGARLDAIETVEAAPAADPARPPAPAHALRGFAAPPPAPFRRAGDPPAPGRAPEAPPRLTAIEGNPDAPRGGPGRKGGGPRLRVVKS